MKTNRLLGSLLFASVVLPASVFAADSSFYLRCNSTSWQAVEESRLKPTGNGHVVALSYQVNDDAVASYGEDCALSETSAVNAWGEWQKDYDLGHSALNTNAFTAIGDGSVTRPFNFKVNYAGKGTYRVALNLDSKQLYLSKDGQGHDGQAGHGGWHHPAPAPTPAPSADAYWYLRCNTTSWETSDASRFKPSYGDVLSLDINVSSDAYVANGDDCKLTQTTALNSWGEWFSNYDLDGAKLDQWNTAYFGQAVAESYSFKVNFSSTGAHKAYLNPKTFQVWVR